MSQLEPSHVIRKLVLSSFTGDGDPEFDPTLFDAAWGSAVEFFQATQLSLVHLVPLPGVKSATIPLDLDATTTVVDLLTEDEVVAALTAGLVQPFPVDSDVLFDSVILGVRRTIAVDKVVGGDLPPAESGEGSFGDRPITRFDLFADDILATLRLHSTASVVAPGSLCIERSWPGRSGVGWNLRSRQMNAVSSLDLQASDGPRLRELWAELRSVSPKRLAPTAVRRFSSAFDRHTLDDQLVDLVIAAEALLLRDAGSPQDRTELGFRLALRGAHFIEHSSITTQEMFRLLKSSYRHRSEVVHGGQLSDASEVEMLIDVLRVGLRQALRMLARGEPFGTAEFWERLVLFGQARVEEPPGTS